MDLEELLDDIRAAVSDIDGDLDYEYDTDIDGATVHVEVCVEGDCNEFELTRPVSISLKAWDLFGSDSTVRDALNQILHNVEEIAKLKLTENTVVFRQPWPGSEKAQRLNTTRKEFADEYDPPTGFVYAGEFRKWITGEFFLNKQGEVEQAAMSADRTSRHILHALPGTVITNTRMSVEPAASSGFSDDELLTAKPL